MKIKGILSLILTLAMVLALASCGKAQPAPTPDASSSGGDASASISAPEEEEYEPDETPSIAPYFAILDTYEEALSDGWDRDRLLEEGLNPMTSNCLDLCEKVGFLLTDSDRDGVDELIIGCNAEDAFFNSMILQMYTLEDGEAVLLMDSAERNRWYWCGDGTALNVGSDSAFHSFWYLCTADREAAFIDCVEYDDQTSPDQPWSVFNGETWNPVTEEEGLAKMEELEGSVCGLELISLTAKEDEPDENGYVIRDGIIDAYVGEDEETTTPSQADTIGNSAFSSDMEHGVNLKAVRVTGNIKTIRDGAFSFTVADSIYLEEGVESIGSSAFSDSYIDEIWFPASVTKLGNAIMMTEEGLQGTTIHVVEGSAAARYFEEAMPYGECELVYDYQ